MTKKEQRIQERMCELYKEHEKWGQWRALTAAVAEEWRKSKVRREGRCRVRPVGLIGWGED